MGHERKSECQFVFACTLLLLSRGEPATRATRVILFNNLLRQGTYLKSLTGNLFGGSHNDPTCNRY